MKALNNNAKYEALLARLRLVEQHGYKKLRIFSDSQLVTNQITEKYQAKNECMMHYLDKVKTELKKLDWYEMVRISKAKNTKADGMMKLMSGTGDVRRSMPIKLFRHPSVPNVLSEEVHFSHTTQNY